MNLNFTFDKCDFGIDAQVEQVEKELHADFSDGGTGIDAGYDGNEQMIPAEFTQLDQKMATDFSEKIIVIGKASENPITIRIRQTAEGVQITVTDKSGTQSEIIPNGKDGKDGIDGKNGSDGKDGSPGKDGLPGKDGTSPVVSISAIEGGHRINITDAEGKKSVDVLNGSDGKNGSNGIDGNGIKSAVLNDDYTLTLTFDDGTRYTTPSIRGATGETGKQGVQGVQGEPGQPFCISKVYPSANAMHLAYSEDGVPEGGFVVIDTGNVDDEDNAKLFIKGVSQYEYLTDLSGAQGIQGNPGIQGVQGIPGEPGQDGKPGVDGITPHIGNNGNWFIGDTDTGIPSRGEDGLPGKDGSDGSPGKDGADGQPGADGYTPQKGTDYWTPADKLEIFKAVYPVGAIYLSTTSTNPATLFGFGTWEQVKDTFLLAAGSTYAAGSTGGSATHTLTVDEMPSHTHNAKGWAAVVDGSGTYITLGGAGKSRDYTTDPTGGGQAHNNMPPYLAVYVWKRTA